MYKLTITLSLVIFTSAKTNFLENDLEDVLPIRKHKNDGIWVLNFDDDFEVNQLRQPSNTQWYIFKNSVAPVIKRNQRNGNENVDFNDIGTLKVTQVSPDISNTTIQEIKLELKWIINKFLHSVAVVDPRQSISKKNEGSLNIYFEGNSCALVLQSGRFRNVYFNDAKYELLPRWFFEKHNNIEHDARGNFVPIPTEVKSEFYEDLLHLVKKLYGCAI